MKTTENLFHESILHYQELIKETTILSEKMAAMSANDILHSCHNLQELQEKQKEIDKFILDIMQDTGPSILEMSCVGEYQRILHDAMNAYNKVASKGKTIRTLINSEIQKLKKGQQGLAAYTSVHQDHKTNMQGRY